MLLLLNSLFRPARPGFLVNSLPKSGTNLLKKVAGLLPGVRDAGLHLVGELAPARPDGPELYVPVDAGSRATAPLSFFRKALRPVRGGRFATAHVPYSPELAGLLEGLEMKTVFIFRDPRDVAVSLAHYAGNNPKLYLHKFFQPLSPSERLLLSINGLERPTPGRPRLLGIGEQCERLLPWTRHPATYSTCYERLVGPRGGGSQDDQVRELANIARHLRLPVSRRRLGRVAER